MTQIESVSTVPYMNLIYIIHRDDALNAAWEAFLAGVPMSWLTREEQ